MNGPRFNPASMPPQAFLLPETASTYSRERRLSTSSMDSKMSHSSSASRLRRNKRASSRVSDFRDDGNDVTLLTFLHRCHTFVSRLSTTSVRVASSLVQRSRPRPKLVCEGQILEETNMACRDYVIYKLTTKDLMSKKLTMTAANWPRSGPVIAACLTLEHSYPHIYSNVSRKLCMTMTSTKVVRAALKTLLDVLFEGQMCWAKIVSMLSVCALFAEECAMQGHPDYVTEVVDTVTDFTHLRLLDWMVNQGGWDCFPCPKEEDNLYENVSRLLVVMILIAVCILCTLVSYYYYCRWC